MWIIKSFECRLHGHSFIDVTANNRPYHYCLHCGGVEEPLAVLKENHIHRLKSAQSV